MCIFQTHCSSWHPSSSPRLMEASDLVFCRHADRKDPKSYYMIPITGTLLQGRACQNPAIVNNNPRPALPHTAPEILIGTTSSSKTPGRTNQTTEITSRGGFRITRVLTLLATNFVVHGNTFLRISLSLGPKSVAPKGPSILGARSSIRLGLVASAQRACKL